MEPNDVDDTSLMTAELDAAPDNPDGRQSQSPDASVPPAADGLAPASEAGPHAASGDAAEAPPGGAEAANGAASSKAGAANGAAPSAKTQSTLDDGYRVALPMFEGP